MAARPRILRTVIDRSEEDDVPSDGISPAQTSEVVDSSFHEETYLKAFPDIAEAVRRGDLPSGLVHFQRSGMAEGRISKPEYLALLATREKSIPPRLLVDSLAMSVSGTTVLIGWTDDRNDELTGIGLETQHGRRQNWTAIPRVARPDVARSLDAQGKHRFGYFLVAAPSGGLMGARVDPLTIERPVFRFAGGGEIQVDRDPVVMTDPELRDLALKALLTAGAEDGAPDACFAILDQQAGTQIAALNRLIADQAAARCLVEYTGPQRAHYRASVITTLRGRADQIVPRLTLCAAGAGADEIEFIVIVTDPAEFEPALRAARLAALTVGVSLTLVLQTDGDPTGTGDVGANAARSGRLIFMDHAVLPKHPSWAADHAAVLASAPSGQTRLMGGLLFRPDGSLGHGGYYFEQQTSIRVRPGDTPERVAGIKVRQVAHPAPSVAPSVTGARPIAAVAGAFLSIDRGWYEKLGGFTRQYCNGGNEDLDLCLKSHKDGVPAWVQPLPMWFLEKRSPTRPAPSKAAAILNDWLLHRRWDERIAADLLGTRPASLMAEG